MRAGCVHRSQQRHRPSDVVVVIAKGVVDRLAHFREGRKVHDDVNLMRGEQGRELFSVMQAASNCLIPPIPDAGQDMFSLSVSTGEVIDSDNTVPMPKQAQDRMRSDVASTSSDENVCDFVTPGLPGRVLDWSGIIPSGSVPGSGRTCNIACARSVNARVGRSERMSEPLPIPISVVILTLDEEINIAECVRSCSDVVDVHVLDSGSSDRTREIAASMGATVWEHPFESFGAQRNWAIDEISVSADWILHLDADERMTPELGAALRTLIATDPAEAGFYLPNKLMLMGRWLKRCAGYPTYQMRLFHRSRMRFQDFGHGQRELTDGAIGTIDEPYLHYAFSKGVSDWLAKHNRYSTDEAHQAMESGGRIRIWDVFSSDRICRRRAMKRLSFRLPMRHRLRVIQLLFLQGGILEGRAAMLYARLIAIYEQMTYVKYRLLRQGTSDFESDSRCR